MFMRFLIYPLILLSIWFTFIDLSLVSKLKTKSCNQLVSIQDYKRDKTEKLCPYKCQGMAFIIYSDDTVKCRTCNKISKLSDLIDEY